MQTSDHSLILLDSKLQVRNEAKQFYFDKRLLELQRPKSVIGEALNKLCRGTPMFQVTQRINQCRVAQIKLRWEHCMNSGKDISNIKGRMKVLQLQRG